MAIELNDNLKILVGAPIDNKYLDDTNSSYTNIGEVNTAIGTGQRYVGLTVNISNEEYWYKDGVDDLDLIEKLPSGGTGGGIDGIQNIGIGTGEIYSGLSGNTAELRTIIGSGDTVVTTNGAEITIFSEVSGDAQPNYTGASPSNIDAGGMVSGTILTGKTLSEIIEDIATTIYVPTFVQQSNTFGIISLSSTLEAGITLGTINFEATFDDGDQILQGTSITGRSGAPNAYNYGGTSLPVLPQASTSYSATESINNYELSLGNNDWTSSVSYDEGPQPLDSNGDDYLSPEPADTTSDKLARIKGIYPWFYGTVSSATRPTANQALIDSGNSNKQVTQSTGTISVGNYNAIGQWIWFAIPDTSAAKTVWEGSNSPSNTGAIGGVVSAGENLFPDPDIVSIESPDYSTINWTGVNYKIYISNYETSTNVSGTEYTLTFKNN